MVWAAALALAPGSATSDTRAPSSGSLESAAQLDTVVARLLPVRWRSSFRSSYARSRDDGPLWSGVGFSTLLSAGVFVSWGPLRLTVAPEAYAWENRDHATPVNRKEGYSRWAYPWAFVEIDSPTRFGGAGTTGLDLGESRAEAEFGPLRLGVSSSSVRRGPALRYPILFGSSAPGFHHAFVDLQAELEPWGRIRGQMIWGRVRESAYFDTDPFNDGSDLSIASVGLEPTFLEGLELEAVLVARGQPTDRGLAGRFVRSLVAPFQENSQGEVEDLTAGFSASWQIQDPEVRIFVEWSRSDFFENVEDFLGEPEHGQAYALGLTRGWGTTRAHWRLHLEHASTAASNPAQSYRGAPSGTNSTVYRHGTLRQGHTHRGQLLGASIGPGSLGSYLALARETRSWTAEIQVERVLWDRDAFQREIEPAFAEAEPDQEFTLALRTAGFALPALVSGVRVDLLTGVSVRRNRQYLPFSSGGDGARLRETNWWADLTVEWRPPT